MKKSITIEIKDVYGVETIYPVCPAARAFAAIACHKTLTPNTMKQIRILGYDIEIQGREVKPAIRERLQSVGWK